MSGPITVFHAQDGQLVRWMRPGTVVTPTVPGAPSAVVGLSPSSSSAKLTWGVPAVTGGSPITGYVVTCTGATSVTTAATARAYSFGSLVAGSVHTLTVAAVNAVGTGPAVSKSVTVQTGVVTGSRFPGDPNPKLTGGRLYWGESRQGGTDPAPEESGTGTTVGNRHIYWDTTKVPNALAVPNGPMAQAALDAHSRNRLPLLSWHIPGSTWAGAANGARDAEIDAWIAWCEAQAKPIYWVVNHEPENGDGPAPDFRAWMQHIRARITVYEQAHGKLQRLCYMGCLMAYTFTGGNGGPLAWWPGDGVWDVMGIDIYVDLQGTPASGPSTTILNNAWSKVIAFANLHNAPLFVTEWGVRPDNPNGAQIMQDFYDYCTSGAQDIVGMSYFNTGWWVLGDNNGMLTKFRTLMKAAKSIHMSDLGF